MNGDGEMFRAQLVMKAEDGRSILTEAMGKGDVTPARAEEIRKLLAGKGFVIEEGNLNTLSIAGEPGLFREVFGMTAAKGPAAEAQRIAPELAPFVATVVVTPPPEFFP
jgi:hypothetical protein